MLACFIEAQEQPVAVEGDNVRPGTFEAQAGAVVNPLQRGENRVATFTMVSPPRAGLAFLRAGICHARLAAAIYTNHVYILT